MKQSIGPDTLLLPLPVVVVSTYDSDGKPNMMTASWTGIVNSQPAMVSVSLRKATYSYDSIIQNSAFTISLPSRKHLLETDYVGTKSGRREDKFATTSLTPVASDLVNAPYVSEFPLILECKLIRHEDLGLHTMFIAEIIDVKINKECLLPSGKPDIQAIAPVSYAHGEREYYQLGSFLGKANRMWKASHLNPTLMNQENRDVTDLILGYYQKIDDGAPASAFQHDFMWDRACIDNSQRVISNFDEFKDWYQEIQLSIFDRRHIVNAMKITQVKEGRFLVSLDMVFQAKSWQPGAASSHPITVTGKIEWTLLKEDNSKHIKAITCRLISA